MRGHAIEVSAEVADLHRRAFVLDLHNDLLLKLTHGYYDISRRHRPAAFWNPLRLDLDVPRARDGGIDALGCVMFAGFRFDEGHRRFWRQLAEAQRLAAEHAADLRLARDAGEMRAAAAAGRIALFVGVEGSYAIDDDVEAGVQRLAAARVCFLGPLWQRDSRAASSCRTRARLDRGLSDVGRALVAACNRSGILLDVAHASRRAFWDMVEASATPVFASHSGAASVRPHPRNLDDDQIAAIARRGGVVGVIFASFHLGGLFCTFDRLADHIEHVAKVGGEECVALGSDFDGLMPLPRGMRDAADLPRLTEVLWRRGWREPALRKLLGENALRYFETTAA